MITIDKVIEARGMAWYEYIQFFNALDWITLIIGIPFFAVFCASTFNLPYAFDDDEISDSAFAVIFVVMMAIVSAVLIPLVARQYEPEGWREEIAEPFYESLPVTTETLNIVGITKLPNSEMFDVVYEVTDAKGYVAHETITAPIKRVKEIESVVYEYKFLSKDIPHFKEAGKNEAIVKIPLDYKFPNEMNAVTE